MSIPRFFMLTVLVSLLGTAGATHADDSSEYKSLTAAAVEEHGLGHYEEARALFAKAHAIDPNARTLWGMGVAAFEARQYVDAIELLEASRKDQRKPLTSAQRKQADSLLERSRDFVVRLPIRVTPRNATVSIDGRVLTPDAQGIVLLDAGTHQVVISAAGYEELTRSMRWSAGDAAAFDVQLERKQSAQAAPAQPAEGAGAQSAPAAAADDRRSSSAFSPLKWVSLGGTVASLGVMGAGIALRESAVAYYNDDVKCMGDKDLSCPQKKLDAEKWKKMAIGGAVASGVFATLAVVFFVLDRRPRGDGASARTQCEPAFTLGASCRVQF